jgi:hypothetical protein
VVTTTTPVVTTTTPVVTTTTPRTISLTLIKVVNGGTAEPDDFGITLTGPGGAIAVQWGVTLTNLAPGVYDVAETNNQPFYDTGIWGGDCTNTGDGTGTVTLSVGGSTDGDSDFECTITNTDPRTSTTTTSTTTTTTLPTTTPFVDTTTTTADTTTTTLVLGAELPFTGPGDLVAWLVGGFGLVLLGAGLILLAPRQDPRWVV